MSMTTTATKTHDHRDSWAYVLDELFEMAESDTDFESAAYCDDVTSVFAEIDDDEPTALRVAGVIKLHA